MTASSFFSRRRGAGWRPRQGLGFRGRRPSSKISSNMVLAAFAVLFAQHQIIKNSCLAVNVKAISASATSGEVETSVVAKTIRDEPASCSSSNTLSFEFRNLQISKADKIPALRSALSTTGPTTAERHHQADHGVVASASSTSGASSASVELEPPSTIAAAAEGDEDRTLLIAAKPDDGGKDEGAGEELPVIGEGKNQELTTAEPVAPQERVAIEDKPIDYKTLGTIYKAL